MKSIKTKITLLVMICTSLASIAVGVLSIQNARKLINEDSTKLMNQACENSGQEIDAVISRIEQSVETMADCVLNDLTDLKRFQTDPRYVALLTDNVENTLLSAADNTEGAITAYLRFNPDFTAPTSGLFFSKSSADGAFSKLVPTDFSIYDKNDDAHVGWYYIPIENHKSTWMSPYLNENLQVYMISYVIPLYKDNIPIGVVGMDIDFSLIQKSVDQTQIYNTGYAFLTDQDNRIMHHKSLPLNEKLEDLNMDGRLDGLCAALREGNSDGKLIPYEYEGETKDMVHRELKNGMRLVLTAPLSEINASANRLIFQIISSTLAAVGISILVALFIIRGVVRPMTDLNRAASRIAEGDFDVTVSCRSKDEVGALSKSLSRTVERLREYIDYIGEISAVLEEIARGNLVFELQYEYAGEFSKIRESLLHISHSLNHTLLEINESSEQVTRGSGQVASGAQALSQGATQQAAAVQELSANIQEISRQVNANAENSREASSLAFSSGQSVEESNQYMKEMAAAMDHIADTSNKIHQIVKTVDEIASQTNILALNAAVEAARAGEAGKGFVVVADEVRSLASKVGEATKNIAGLVQNASEAIDDGMSIVDKTENSLKAVVEKSGEIEKKIQEIANSSQGQASALEQVNIRIDQISAVVQTNSATAEEEAASSGEMSRQAQVLKDLIGRFHLDTRNSQ